MNWLELLGSGVVQQSLPKSAGLSTIPHPLPPPLSQSPSFQASPEKSAGASALSSSQSPCFYSESRTSTSSGPLTSASWSNSRKGRFLDSSRFQNSRPVIRTLLFGYPARGGQIPFHGNDMMEIVRNAAGDPAEDVKLVFSKRIFVENCFFCMV